MNPELLKRIELLEKKMNQMETLKLPLSPTVMGAINQAFISYFFNKFNVRRLLLTAGNAVDPVVEGEVVYHSTTPSIKVMLGGTVKTITVT